ncbi:hypothetical protein VP01_2648g2 [Puccinia sorghi]|uniref:Uncharacterized protein n=1 Tax=Puccinia sorghi TaxID=27349 RepID=A0A0L6V469_9BASI|nr:hypothetical protein VP01_2648g2 [Puccinia sorghi]
MSSQLDLIVTNLTIRSTSGLAQYNPDTVPNSIEEKKPCWDQTNINYLKVEIMKHKFNFPKLGACATFGFPSSSSLIWSVLLGVSSLLRADVGVREALAYFFVCIRTQTGTELVMYLRHTVSSLCLWFQSPVCEEQKGDTGMTRLYTHDVEQQAVDDCLQLGLGLNLTSYTCVTGHSQQFELSCMNPMMSLEFSRLQGYQRPNQLELVLPCRSCVGILIWGMEEEERGARTRLPLSIFTSGIDLAPGSQFTLCSGVSLTVLLLTATHQQFAARACSCYHVKPKSWTFYSALLCTYWQKNTAELSVPLETMPRVGKIHVSISSHHTLSHPTPGPINTNSASTPSPALWYVLA